MPRSPEIGRVNRLLFAVVCQAYAASLTDLVTAPFPTLYTYALGGRRRAKQWKVGIHSYELRMLARSATLAVHRHVGHGRPSQD